jgi:hypothetical protein
MTALTNPEGAKLVDELSDALKNAWIAGASHMAEYLGAPTDDLDEGGYDYAAVHSGRLADALSPPPPVGGASVEAQSPASVGEWWRVADPSTVWRVCRLIKGECKNCPPSEIDGDRDEVTRGCYLQAVECVNTVQTGNPWRKTEGVKAPWVALIRSERG